MSSGVGCRRGSDPGSLWLWGRPAATALIQPLAWEPPYAAGAALEKTKRQKKKKRERERSHFWSKTFRDLSLVARLALEQVSVINDLKGTKEQIVGVPIVAQWVKNLT